VRERRWKSSGRIGDLFFYSCFLMFWSPGFQLITNTSVDHFDALSRSISSTLDGSTVIALTFYEGPLIADPIILHGPDSVLRRRLDKVET
jgi:hypothetical protein